MAERIIGSMATTDGRWRVEAVRERRRDWYRVYRDGEVFADQLVIGRLLRVLHEEGVEMADLIE